MATVSSGTTCADHRRREALVRCVVCDRPLCSECIVSTPVGRKCHRCTGGKKKAAARSQGRGDRSRASGSSRAGWVRRHRGLLAVVAGVGLVVLAAVGLLRGGDDAGSEEAVVPPGVGSERNVQVTGANGQVIGGTVNIPEAAAEGPVPGVLIVPGFGPTNRDGIAPPGGVADQLYRDIAEALADVGIASFRYDKRGVGQSVMDPEDTLLFDDMVTDAAAGITFLEERVEVDPDAIAVLGHDQGGLIGLRLAASDERVRRLVLVATPGRPLVDVLSDDLVNSSADAEMGEEVAAELQGVVDEMLASGHPPEPDELSPALRPVFPVGEGEYLEAIFTFDPVAEAREVDVPVLVVVGGRDTGVSEVDAELLVDALAGPAEVVVGPDASHTLMLPAEDRGAGEVASSDRDHDAAFHSGGQPTGLRDRETLDRITAWLAEGLPGA